MKVFVESAYQNLKKAGEELCGDNVEIIKTPDSTIIVLADGLGSGVKANILSTMTVKIASTMMKNNMNVEEVVKTMIQTLPVCRIRRLAYSTFTILKVSHKGNAHLIEFDNPQTFYLKKGKLAKPEVCFRDIEGRRIRESRFLITEGDQLYIVSDGVVHAGVGGILNLGWKWENVGHYLERLSKEPRSIYEKIRLLITACAHLYAQKPGDDATVVGVEIKSPRIITLFTGPPRDRSMDARVVKKLVSSEGKKVVCGGTAANIVARELKQEILTDLEFIDPRVPPTGKIKGIDLVTEGVLTLNRTVELLRNLELKDSNLMFKTISNNKDGASLLANLLLNQGTHLKLLVGRAVNPAHQNPNLPEALSLKLKIVKEMAELLKKLGKEVTVEYF